MRLVLRVFAAVHAVLALLFVIVAVLMMVVAARTGWDAVVGGLDTAAGVTLIEAMGLITVAAVSLQIAQTDWWRR